MRAWWLPCLALAGCAPRSSPLSSAIDPWDRPVATFDGRPVLLREVIRTAVETDRNGMLRRHLVRLVIAREREKLAIVNSDEERLARARGAVASLRANPAFGATLQQSGLTEEEYARQYSRTPHLDALLATEKIVAAALLRSESAEIDVVGFDRRDDAEKYRQWADRPFDRAPCEPCRGAEAPCAAHAPPRPSVRIEGLRVVRGALAEDLGADAEAAIFASLPGDRIGPVRDKSGAWAVLQVLARHPPRPDADIMELVLSDPPDELEIKTHLDWLLRSGPIAIEQKD